MARLLRAMPELLVLIKGMAVAARSVFFTLCLLGGIIYVFAIAFVQLMKGTEAGDEYFGSVPQAMNSLLLQGVLPDQADIVEGAGSGHWIFKVIILIYILLSSLTVMNMLVGVLCEVVSVVSSVEKESLLVNHVKGTLLHMLQDSGIDSDGDHLISKDEFATLLENPMAAKAMQEVGVDVIGLVDFTDFIFKDGRELTFPDFMEMVLQLRGSNTATVKDMVDLRKLMVDQLDKTVKQLSKAFEKRQSQTESPLQWQSAMMDAGRFSPTLGLALPPPMPYPGSEGKPENQGLTWATAASVRLTEAASQLSAAASELSNRNRKRQQQSRAAEVS